ncbi:MAG: type II secretion system F family protein [Gemmatimonas sp.]
MNAVLSYLPIAPADVPVALAALAAGFAALAAWSGLTVRGHRMRARDLVARRAELRSQLLGDNRRRRAEAPAMSGLAMTVVRRLKLLQGQKTAEIRLKLAQAGIRSRDALATYLFFKLAAAPILGALALLLFKVFGLYHLSDSNQMFVSVGAVLAGFMGPEMWVKNRITKRLNVLRKAIPDGLDLLVVCVEAGLSTDAALTRVAKETERSAPELSDEFRLTAIELGFLPERRQALEGLARRVQLPAVRALVAALLQTEKYGTPLATSLRVLSAEFRTERLLRAEEKAARLPATLTVPMVLFILPCLFIVIIGPGIINVIDNFRMLK